uniref:Uncharacterized protein n=1 Tax=Romanomermis culicivorax TaxID=13658 RepID=A0A915IMW1_ROMCU
MLPIPMCTHMSTSHSRADADRHSHPQHQSQNTRYNNQYDSHRDHPRCRDNSYDDPDDYHSHPCSTLSGQHHHHCN